MTIKKGDRVKYIDTESKQVGRKRIVYKVEKFGTWDGEKVVLEDECDTTIRKKEWLEKVLKK